MRAIRTIFGPPLLTTWAAAICEAPSLSPTSWPCSFDALCAASLRLCGARCGTASTVPRRRARPGGRSPARARRPRRRSRRASTAATAAAAAAGTSTWTGRTGTGRTGGTYGLCGDRGAGGTGSAVGDLGRRHGTGLGPAGVAQARSSRDGPARRRPAGTTARPRQRRDRNGPGLRRRGHGGTAASAGRIGLDAAQTSTRPRLGLPAEADLLLPDRGLRLRLGSGITGAGGASTGGSATGFGLPLRPKLISFFQTEVSAPALRAPLARPPAARRARPSAPSASGGS